MNLIILERDELNDGQVTLSDARATHLLNVLKVTPGQTVRVGLLDGPHGTATVTSARDGHVTVRCDFETTVPPLPRVDLLLALPRPKVMRRLWAQLAALGVGNIILTNAERVERNYFDTHVLTAESYRPLLMEGLQQARDTHLPAVSIHRQFRILVEDDLDALFAGGVRLVADPRATMSVDEAVRAAFAAATAPKDHRGDRVLVAVGPEGGWNAFELALLKTHGFQPIGMGPRTLRVDTACVALLALLHHAIQNAIDRR